VEKKAMGAGVGVERTCGKREMKERDK